MHLHDYFTGWHPDLIVRERRVESRTVVSFQVSAKVEAARGDTRGFACYNLGIAVGCTRWAALVRHRIAWLGPRHGSHTFSFDRDAIMVSFLRDDGLSVVILAVSGIRDVVTTLQADHEGNLLMQVSNDGECTDQGHVLIAAACTHECALAEVMHRARTLVASTKGSAVHLKTMPNEIASAETWCDGLAYCTWDGIGQNLSEDSLLAALRQLKKDEVCVTNLIIDDGWQSISFGDDQFERAWTEFEADANRFPNGLAITIKKIREEFPHIQYVAVWHALLGYWGGVSATERIAQQYKTRRVQVSSIDIPGSPRSITVVDETDVERMYDDFYECLASCGVNSVKADAQCFVDAISQAPARRELIQAYLRAQTTARDTHFESKGVSCMSQLPQTLFDQQLVPSRVKPVVRNSDDFFPDAPGSDQWHIFCNANNSLLTQHLQVVPDWDMFQTQHEWGSFHAAARAVSGGPVCITDLPGRHDLALLSQLTASTPDGRSVTLRLAHAGKTATPYAAYDEPALVKIVNGVGEASNRAVVMGMFNCRPHPIMELVTFDEFISGQVIVQDFQSGKVSRARVPGGAGEQTSLVAIGLEHRGWAILTAHRLSAFSKGLDGRYWKLSDANDRKTMAQDDETWPLHIGVLGLVDKFTGVAAVIHQSVETTDYGQICQKIVLKALGLFGVYIDDLEDRDVCNTMKVLLEDMRIDEEHIKRSPACPQVLHIDVLSAWTAHTDRGPARDTVTLQMLLS